MKPCFFGPPDKRLFGVHHPSANAAPARPHGVVMCYPIGQEYVRIHRTFRQLAARLAKLGYDVLRFDYRGTGDSAGESKETRLERWEADITTAIEELAAVSGGGEVHLVGLKLGASLAYRAAARRDDVQSLVLWEPVVDGGAYVRRMAHGTAPGYVEIAGFPFQDAMRTDVESLSLLDGDEPRARAILIIDADAGAEGEDLHVRLEGRDFQVTRQCIPGSDLWDDHDEFGQGMVPYAAIESIVEWFRKL